jgi:metallo-beta-lactamase class B
MPPRLTPMVAQLLCPAALALACRATAPAAPPGAGQAPAATAVATAPEALPPAPPAAGEPCPPCGAGEVSLTPDPPMTCDACEEWNAPREPFRVYGNTYFVGTRGLSSILLVGSAGSVLIDGGLSQSAALIAKNIRKLGFRLADVRILLNSHTHYDHAGGIAALQRASGATVLASPASRRALQRGEPTPDDPQFGFGHGANAFPSVPQVQVIQDNQTLTLGDLAITARFTPGHTPGGTSWTWSSCEGSRCLDIVYADSLTAISSPGFLYTKGDGEGDRVESFRASIDRVAALHCDILLAPHPGFLALDEKLAAKARAPASNPFIDPAACRSYATAARERLAQRIAEEHGALAP